MISIVQYSRNDNHGGNLLKRMKLSFYSNIHLLEKLKINSEIILVDYNTPKDKPNLYKLLPIDKPLKYVKVRHLIVPPEIHDSFKDSKKIPMNNMLARNIGIRRSSGEYILSTGIDIIFSEEIVEKFKNLKPNKIYRANRYDVNRCILDVIDIDHFDIQKVLNLCEKNIIDVHFNTNLGNFEDTNIPSLHTNNCGDFQLTHRDIWFSLHGYPEIDLMGTHCDTIFEYMAYLSGNEEIIFDEKIYHIDHDNRWLKPIYTHILRNWRLLFLKFGYDVMKYKEEYYKLAKRISKDYGEKTYLENIGYKVLSNEEYKKIILDMIYGKRSLIYNNDNWGLPEIKFEEIVI